MTTIRALLERARTEDYITAKELALLARFDVQTIRRKIQRGEIPGVVRLGRKGIRIHRDTALRWAACLSAE